MKKNGNCDKNSDNFLVEFKSTSKQSIVKKRKRKRMDGGRKREVGEDYAGGVISPFSSFRGRKREKEKVRSMPLHRNAATCYSTSFLPADEKFRGEGIGFVYAKRRAAI